MTTPTEENIREIAELRAKRIKQSNGTVDGVVARALHYANRDHHQAETAQQAVSWAIMDLPGES